MADPSGIGIRDLAPGLWIWRARHPFWAKGADWQEVVTSTLVESKGERIVLDPIAPALDPIGLWERLDKNPPTQGIVTLPDHIRDIDMFARRYGIHPMGPLFFFPEQVPKLGMDPIWAEKELPGGLVPLYDARGRAETPIWVPDKRVIIFGDALTERGGELRVWDSPWHLKRELPALREMLSLPFDRVIVSHCGTDPVQPREEFERALGRPPWHG
ncbi:MAG: MBL fold metallo-hydrolase [Nitrososphaerota archaeon]|nr:MBL fold metallo-hydrolase [Nitrososphaerota archaeon]